MRQQFVQPTTRFVEAKKPARLRGRGRARKRADIPAPYKSQLEARYAGRLELLLKAGEIARWKYEAHSLKLGNGARYTPDFWVVLPSGLMEFHETKGQKREAAMVRVKVGASEYPEYRFVLVEAEGKNGFKYTEVEP